MRQFQVINRGTRRYGIYYRNISSNNPGPVFPYLTQALKYFYNEPIVSKSTQRQLKDDNNKKQFIVYTDGGMTYSNDGSPKSGAWAYIIDSKSGQEFNSGVINDLPNDAVSEDMELTAIMRALYHLKENGETDKHIILHCDCIGMELIFDYRNKTDAQRKNEMGHHTPNKMKEINSLCHIMRQFKNLVMQKVKGHNGIPGNMFVDQLCTANLHRNRNKNNRSNQRNVRWFYDQADLDHAITHDAGTITNILQMLGNGKKRAKDNETYEKSNNQIINSEKSIQGNVASMAASINSRYNKAKQLYSETDNELNTIRQLINNAHVKQSLAATESEKDFDIHDYLHVDHLSDLDLPRILRVLQSDKHVVDIKDDFTRGLRILMVLSDHNGKSYMKAVLAGKPLMWNARLCIRKLDKGKVWQRYWDNTLDRQIKSNLKFKYMTNFIDADFVQDGTFYIRTIPITRKDVITELQQLYQLYVSINPNHLRNEFNTKYQRFNNRYSRIPFWRKIRFML